ncbi:MAG: hypothetical protein AB1305_05095 [Candidatus Hadarchaeota archaeon]
MSDEAPAQPSPQPSGQRPFEPLVLGVLIIAVGVVLINIGANAIASSNQLLMGFGLLVGGVGLAFAGASKILPKNPLGNLGLFILGIFMLLTSGSSFSQNWQNAVYGVSFLAVGLGMIVVGVDVAKEGWSKR